MTFGCYRALMTATEIVAAEWARACAGTLDFIDSMPEEHLNFKPVPESLSFAEQYIHVAEANYIFAASACAVENPNPTRDAEQKAELKATRAALRTFVEGSYNFVVESVKQLDPDRLVEAATFFGSSMPRYLILAKGMEHHAHHRGQTAVYFRLNRRNPPSERLF